MEAYNQDQTSFPVLKWVAVTTGQLTDYLGTKEKIEQGSKFKEYLDKALAMDKKEYSLLHMRGRYAFGVAGLSWFERNAASVFYSTPPTATFDEALADFLAAHETRPDWLENVFYIAKTYLQMKDKANAKKYLTLGLGLKAADESEREMHVDMQKMLKKVQTQ